MGWVTVGLGCVVAGRKGVNKVFHVEDAVVVPVTLSKRGINVSIVLATDHREDDVFGIESAVSVGVTRDLSWELRCPRSRRCGFPAGWASPVGDLCSR